MGSRPSSAPDTIVLIHDFWVTPRRWELWLERYEAEGWAHFRDGREAVAQAIARAPDEVRERFTWLPIGEAAMIPA